MGDNDKQKLIITMKKIVELLFCLVALIALLVGTQYLENADDAQKEESISPSENVDSAAENVAMLSIQE